MPKPTTIPGSYRRLLQYTFQYKTFFVVSVIGFALSAWMEASLVSVLEFFINTLEGKPSKQIYGMSSAITSAIWFVPISVIVLNFFRGIGLYIGNFYMSKLGLNVVNNLRKTLFGHMVYLPQSFYDQRNSGELVSLIVYNIEQVTGSITSALKILFRDGLAVLFYLSLLVYYNWKLTLVFFVIAPLLGGMVYLASNYFRKTSHRIQTAVSMVSHISMEAFQGIKLVKSFRGEKYETTRFDESAETNLRYATKYEQVKAFQTPALHMVIAFALALIFWLVLTLWTGTAAEAVVYVTLAGFIAKPFRQLSTVNAVIQKGAAAADTIFSTLDIAQEQDTGTAALTNIKGRIEFDQVDFAYNKEKTTIEGLSFVIEPGETVALVGKTGSGKSTLASLLLRYYTIQSGDIRIDGHSLADISNASLRDSIALVNQQTILFNDTVRANIGYGMPQENIEEHALLEAAKNASALEFIEKLPTGFDTLIGEDGARLSGGQRQRIAIARALLKDAPILILDEATSALDNESEKQIQLALDTLKQGRTTLVIAHRLSTIENADKIIVLDEGKIAEMGNHQSLIEAGGIYANLHASQISSTDD